MLRLALPLLLLLAACGRPLSPHEAGFIAAFMGDSIDISRVRLHGDLAPTPVREVPVRPRITCQERIYPPPRGATHLTGTGGLTLFTDIWIRPDLYVTDFFHGLETGEFTLADVMLFAHEMIHVWQWQNRALTGYNPAKAALEHVGAADPYLFDPRGDPDFLDYAYEQQGAVFEEYLCCRTLAPAAPRTRRLHQMLGDYFPLPDLGRPIAQSVWLPWSGVDVQGICD